jgi:Protein of unknown function (DUF1573)
MKTLLRLVVFSVLAGVALGVAVVFVEVRPWAVVELSPAAHSHSSAAASETDSARAVFPETTYKFGNMERGATLSHAFKVRNAGTQPLQVKVESTTCKCTVGELAKNEIGPDQETDIVLEWTAKTPAGPFRHGAIIGTNDPHHSHVDLVVEGEVVESSSIVPPEMVFANVTTGQSREAHVYVMSNLQPEVKVLDYKFTDEKMASQFDVQIIPVDKSELPNPEAMSGVKVSATYRAGSTIGQSNCWLELTTNLEKSPKLSILVAVSTAGDISVYGPGWAQKLGLLNMGAVRSEQGKKVRLNLAVRGDLAQATKVEVVSTDPAEMKVTLGEPQTINEELVHIPLFVEIPPGTPPMVRTGEPASTDAQIILNSNHPHASEVQLRVHFTVVP